MALSNQHFSYISTLVDQLEQGDNFSVDLETFRKYSEELRAALYRLTDHPDVLRRLNSIQRIEPLEESQGIWGSLLPKSSFGMYDKFKKKEHIMEQVREIASTFSSIQFILQNDFS